ncbi:hypothetical protein [Bacillus sp. EB01]|uniref:hypothetical protein n=1 Tax=Bacillus sp. EB01 TaxID=1347086 RepID=UPI000A57C9F0|nr:hypothetical protein [Bacillus sp. EB01]
MREPMKIMILGISIMLLALFIQNISSWGSGPSNVVQILIIIGFISTLVGFFLKK